MSYLIVDAANLFFRARHVIRTGDPEERVAMSYHIILASVLREWRDRQGKHVVFCFEGRSWRKDIYAPYKANRAEGRAKHTVKEAEEEKLFWESFDKFYEYISTKTNVTVLRNPVCEADDFIARWIQLHPSDNHTIVSSDTDFEQLVAHNVQLFNGISGVLTTHEGYYDDKRKPIKDKKTGEVKGAPDPEWLLFEKCMRGDTSDNVFSAYPGVREKGTKNKVGLREAFADRDNKGFMWNNLMLQRWTDHEGVEHLVRDDYERNRSIIDLTAQPDNIKAVLDQAIAEAVQKEKNPSVGPHFMKFCGKYGLQKASDNAQQHTQWLAASYN
jgi:5'-3' exonuclease